MMCIDHAKERIPNNPKDRFPELGMGYFVMILVTKSLKVSVTTCAFNIVLFIVWIVEDKEALHKERNLETRCKFKSPFYDEHAGECLRSY